MNKTAAAIHVITLLMFVLKISGFCQSGQIVEDSLYSASIHNSVTKEKPVRHLLVYLPPSYKNDKQRKFPVLYLLHGIGDTDSVWAMNKGEMATINSVADFGVKEKRFGEMIIVMPDEITNWFGSYYCNSSVTGNWDDFTTKELVGYIDKKYRTISNAENRAIAGHSMGGYGALTLGMKHPETFSTVYGINPSLIAFTRDLSISNPAFQKIIATTLEAKTYQDLYNGGIYSIGMVTVAQAFSPNRNAPPFYADMPYKISGGRLMPSEPAFGQWLSRSATEMIPMYQDNLKKLKAYKFDSGYEDEFLYIPTNCRDFSNALSAYGIDHIFEEYNGDHRNRLWGKNGRMLTEILPFIWFNIKN